MRVTQVLDINDGEIITEVEWWDGVTYHHFHPVDGSGGHDIPNISVWIPPKSVAIFIRAGGEDKDKECLVEGSHLGIDSYLNANPPYKENTITWYSVPCTW